MKVTLLEKTRKDKKLSKAGLARLTSMQSGTIGWIEEGRFKPYDSQLAKLADALNVDDPDSLLKIVEA